MDKRWWETLFFHVTHSGCLLPFFFLSTCVCVCVCVRSHPSGCDDDSGPRRWLMPLSSRRRRVGGVVDRGRSDTFPRLSSAFLALNITYRTLYDKVYYLYPSTKKNIFEKERVCVCVSSRIGPPSCHRCVHSRHVGKLIQKAEQGESILFCVFFIFIFYFLFSVGRMEESPTVWPSPFTASNSPYFAGCNTTWSSSLIRPTLFLASSYSSSWFFLEKKKREKNLAFSQLSLFFLFSLSLLFLLFSVQPGTKSRWGRDAFLIPIKLLVICIRSW